MIAHLCTGLNKPEYCVTDPNVTLTGLPLGGLFTGEGIVSNDTFAPSTVNDSATAYAITYNYTDENGCGNHVSQSIYVTKYCGK